MSVEKILVIDDEPIIREMLNKLFQKQNIDVDLCENGKQGIQSIQKNSYDLVICDLKMPDLSGIDVLKKVREKAPETAFIMITAHGTIDNAVEAMHLGAFNYLVKPFSPEALLTIIEKLDEQTQLIQENSYLRKQVNEIALKGTRKVIAESPQMKEILSNVIRIAPSSASVFLNGESGTGKEVIAQLIHHHSKRTSHPFIKVNCAALPETLIESEFFGHEKGAFTGANQKKPGRFELAHGGTLLLDEVSEIPSNLQAKLLRVTQEQEFERVGGTKPVQVDVRLISTTNRPVNQMLEEKILREDLYFRLNVVPIALPPLRDRRDDIIPLCENFLDQYCQDNHKSKKTLTSESKKKLLEYPWPGNVRELANIMERVVVMDFGQKIAPEHLFLQNGGPPRGMTLKELEKKLIVETLQEHQENRKKAAEVLGITSRTLTSKLKEYGI